MKLSKSIQRTPSSLILLSYTLMSLINTGLRLCFEVLRGLGGNKNLWGLVGMIGIQFPNNQTVVEIGNSKLVPKPRKAQGRRLIVLEKVSHDVKKISNEKSNEK